MHYYKRNLGDYAKKAGRLSMLQHGSYTLLIDACYDREQFPTKAEALDWTWASSTAEIEAVEFVLSKFFVLEGDRYVQTRIREELTEYQEKAAANKRIADERETKRKASLTNREDASNDAVTNRARIVHEPSTDREDAVTTCERIVHEPSTNRARTVHEPSTDRHLTTNHKPLTNTKPKGLGDTSPPDPIFGDGLRFLKGKGLDEKLARSFLGKLRKDAGDIATIRALVDAETHDVSEPIPWLTKAVRAPPAVERQPWN